MRYGPVKYSESAEWFERALKEYPKNIDWLFGLGFILGRKDRYDCYGHQQHQKAEAVTADREESLLRQVIKLDPGHGLARVFLSEKIRYTRKREARYQIEEALRKMPGNTVVLQRSGQYFRRLRHLDRALDLLNKALKKEPTSSFVHHQIGLVYRERFFQAKRSGHRREVRPGDGHHFLHRAIECYETADRYSKGNHFAAQNDKAVAYTLMGNIEAAKNIYTHLIDNPSIQDQQTQAFFNFAEFYRRTEENIEEALKLYKQAVESRGNRGFIEKAANAIIDHMRARLRRDENDIDALKELGWVYFKTERFSEACQYYEEAFEISNDNSLAQILVEISLKLRSTHKAGRYLEILREFDEDSYNIFQPSFSVMKGEEYTKASKLTDAKNAFAEAIRYGSLVGCQKLLDIMKSASDDEKCTVEWFKQCAAIVSVLDGPESKILQPDEFAVSEDDRPSIGGLRSVLDYVISPFDILRDLYLKYVTSLAHGDTGDKLLFTSSEIVSLAKSVLDDVMSEFQAQHYDLDPEDFKCKFFYVEDEEGVSERVQNKLEQEYKWCDFRSKFPSLFDFIVDTQPGRRKHDRWMVSLFEAYDQLNKMAFPERNVLVSNGDLVNIVDLSRESVHRVARIVQQFKKY
ncbi:interferon-induced protein with tetratricopeptide repeats 1-like [Ptychodera flava]|uniref:interferon-induced protein with tetratricopeptide repeats 1-like n=1 Tax=Ptychodera flava TaxID=63121 RepID=UPI00396A025B